VWRAEFGLSCNALRDAAAVARLEPGGCEGQLSLAVRSGYSDHAPDVVLAHWFHVPALSGRIADLDHVERVKCIVPVKEKAALKSFNDSVIIHKAVGACTTKPRQDRQQVPPAVIRLRAMCRQALAASDTVGLHPGLASAISTSNSPCAGCIGREAEDSCSGIVRRCAICLQSWRLCCSRALANVNKIAAIEIALEPIFGPYLLIAVSRISPSSSPFHPNP
jgi:hypothetical protein